MVPRGGLEARSSVKTRLKNAMHRREFVKRSRGKARNGKATECGAGAAAAAATFLFGNYRPCLGVGRWT